MTDSEVWPFSLSTDPSPRLDDVRLMSPSPLCQPSPGHNNNNNDSNNSNNNNAGSSNTMQFDTADFLDMDMFEDAHGGPSDGSTTSGTSTHAAASNKAWDAFGVSTPYASYVPYKKRSDNDLLDFDFIDSSHDLMGLTGVMGQQQQQQQQQQVQQQLQQQQLHQRQVDQQRHLDQQLQRQQQHQRQLQQQQQHQRQMEHQQRQLELLQRQQQQAQQQQLQMQMNISSSSSTTPTRHPGSSHPGYSSSPTRRSMQKTKSLPNLKHKSSSRRLNQQQPQPPMPLDLIQPVIPPTEGGHQSGASSTAHSPNKGLTFVTHEFEHYEPPKAASKSPTKVTKARLNTKKSVTSLKKRESQEVLSTLMSRQLSGSNSSNVSSNEVDVAVMSVDSPSAFKSAMKQVQSSSPRRKKSSPELRQQPQMTYKSPPPVPQLSQLPMPQMAPLTSESPQNSNQQALHTPEQSPQRRGLRHAKSMASFQPTASMPGYNLDSLVSESMPCKPSHKNDKEASFSSFQVMLSRVDNNNVLMNAPPQSPAPVGGEMGTIDLSSSRRSSFSGHGVSNSQDNNQLSPQWKSLGIPESFKTPVRAAAAARRKSKAKETPVQSAHKILQEIPTIPQYVEPATQLGKLNLHDSSLDFEFFDAVQGTEPSNSLFDYEAIVKDEGGPGAAEVGDYIKWDDEEYL